jgi:Lon protease-like protein
MNVATAPDGRSAVLSVGTRRIRVTQWLPDDPYPMADVEDWPDADDLDDGPPLERVLARLRRVLALQTELGDPAPPVSTEVSDDLLLASYHACALAPLGPDDQYRLLGAAGPGARLRLLESLLADAEELLRFRIS